MMGVVKRERFPTFPDGFPPAFEAWLRRMLASDPRPEPSTLSLMSRSHGNAPLPANAPNIVAETKVPCVSASAFRSSMSASRDMARAASITASLP